MTATAPLLAVPAPTGPSDPGADNQWLTRTPRSSPGAAPWERSAGSESRGRRCADKPTGNHTDGVTVADLIARVSGDASVPEELKKRPDPNAPARATPSPTRSPPRSSSPSSRRTPIRPPKSSPSRRCRTRNCPIWPRCVGPVGCRRRASVPDAPPDDCDHTVGAAGRCWPDARSRPLIAVLALALTGGAWQWQSTKNSMLNRISALDQDSRDIVDPNAQFGDENFLIVGVDSRAGENLEMGAGTPEDAGGARSDTVMLVNIPANRERVVAVSFPRDLAIEPRQCEPWDPKPGSTVQSPTRSRRCTAPRRCTPKRS